MRHDTLNCDGYRQNISANNFFYSYWGDSDADKEQTQTEFSRIAMDTRDISFGTSMLSLKERRMNRVLCDAEINFRLEILNSHSGYP